LKSIGKGSNPPFGGLLRLIGFGKKESVRIKSAMDVVLIKIENSRESKGSID
jgi:hypothetical protein